MKDFWVGNKEIDHTYELTQKHNRERLRGGGEHWEQQRVLFTWFKDY